MNLRQYGAITSILLSEVDAKGHPAPYVMHSLIGTAGTGKTMCLIKTIEAVSNDDVMPDAVL